jgi:hypothetical protein
MLTKINLTLTISIHKYKTYIFVGLLNLSLLILCSVSMQAVAASSDEIQVYDESINARGEFNLDLHMNYVPSGVKESSYPKEITANHDFRLTPEFAYGFTKNWEGGFYLPIIRAADNEWFLEGAKIRLKYIADHHDRGFYWGFNQELGKVSHRTELENWNYELRPILGYKTEDWNLTLNPILGIALSGNDQTPNFSPSFKISRKISETTWLNLENYSDFGPIDQTRNHVQETFLTADTQLLGHNLNFGVGHGWTKESNDITIKAIFNVPL